MKYDVIWDGIEYLEVPQDEARRLEAEDKAQNMSARFISGTEMKTRSEFTGYSSPSTPAETAPAADEAPEDELIFTDTPTFGVAADASNGEADDDGDGGASPVMFKGAEDPMAKAIQKDPMKDWRAYKKVVGEYIGKPFNNVTKADVEQNWRKAMAN